MSDDRLFGASSNPGTRRLLEAGMRDEPPQRALAAVAAALGVAGAAVPVASAATAAKAATGVASASGLGAAPAGVAGAAGAAAAPAGMTAKLGAVALALSPAKWFAMGALLGGVTTAGHFVVVEPRGQAPSAGSVAAPPRAAPPPTGRRHVAAPSGNSLHDPLMPRTASAGAGDGTRTELAPLDESARAPRARSQSRATPRRLPVTDPARAGAVSANAVASANATAVASAAPVAEGKAPLGGGALARETELIDRARRALAANDTPGASALLDEYAALAGVGVLEREALLLRIELAVRRGAFAKARDLAARFRNQYPRDAHLSRLDALLERTGPHEAPELGKDTR